MFIGIKKLATKKVLIPLIALEMFFLIVGTAIKIITVDGIYMDYYPNIRLETLFTNIFNMIPIIILLLSAILLNSSKSEIFFKTSLIASISVSLGITLFTSLDISGGAVFGIIGTLITYAPIIFIIIDCFKNHKYITVSCWVAMVMLGLQVFTIHADLITTGHYYKIVTLCFALRSVLHWLIILIYLTQHVAAKKAEQKTSPISIEGQLQIIKQKYDNGEITQEEYREQKAELLKKL